MLAFIDCLLLLEHVEYGLVLMELEDWKRDYSVEEHFAVKKLKNKSQEENVQNSITVGAWANSSENF